MEQIKSDLADLKHDVKILLQQGAVHNELLRTHEARSLALQQAQELQASKLTDIQKHVDVVNALGKNALGILVGAAATAAGAWLVHLLML